MSSNNSDVAQAQTNVPADEYVTTDKFKVSDLWKQEDWLAIWIGFIIMPLQQ
jgi:hypothetical protein